jgi:hypothetical protein
MKHYNIQKDIHVYFSTRTIVQWQCLFKEEKYFRIAEAGGFVKTTKMALLPWQKLEVQRIIKEAEISRLSCFIKVKSGRLPPAF